MRCIIHCGAPKTCTSALQKALFFDLRDPHFQYFSGGYIDNGSYFIEALFADEPQCRQLYETHLNASRGSFPIYRQRLQRRLDRAVRRCRRRGTTLILSAEGLWRSSPESFSRFRRLRAYLVEQGFEVEVMGYLRPWLPWLSSLYQQSLKFGNPTFGLGMFKELQGFRAIIEAFWSVFGRTQVTFHPYDPALFPGGCIVRHFCQQIGFRCPPGYRTTINESLSLPACGLLFAYNRQRPSLPATGLHQGAEFAPILRQLQQLQGPSLRLHPEVLESWAPAMVAEGPWLEQQLNLWLASTAAVGTASLVKGADDLLRIPPEALSWLEQHSGAPPLTASGEMELERAVASAVQRLTDRGQHHLSLPRRASERLRIRMIHQLHGC